MVAPIVNPLRRAVGSRLLSRHMQRRAAHRLAPHPKPQPLSKTYQVLSRAAARLHARSAQTTTRSVFKSFTSAKFGHAIRSTFQRAISLPLGPVRQAVSRSLNRHLARQISPLLRGAAQAFAAPKPAFEQRINLGRHPLVSFAHSTFRPATGFGPKAPNVPRFHAGVGLQTARNFSSGGRVFDNLVINAPLALRLAGSEAEEKRREAMASKGPRRTAALISQRSRRTMAIQMGKKLAAPAPLKHKEPVVESPSPSVSEDEDYSTLMSTYFTFPAWSPTTRVTIRLSEPIAVMLGNRSPHPSPHQRLFDPAFIEDAQLALAFEEARYLKARAVLRTLYEAGMLDSAEIRHNPDFYVVTMSGVTERHVRSLLEYECGFRLDFVSYHEVGVPSGAVFEDAVLVGDESPSPTLSWTEEQVSLPSLTSEAESSLPSLAPSSAEEGMYLYDSRELSP